MFFSLLVLGFEAGAFGAEALVVSRVGAVLPGRTTELEVVAWDPDGLLVAPLVGVVSEKGEVVDMLSLEERGIHRIWYQGPAKGGTDDVISLRFGDGTEIQSSVHVAEAPPPFLVGAEQVEGVAGNVEAVSLRFDMEHAVDPEDVDVSVTGGRIGGVRLDQGQLVADWIPGSSRAPRVVLVGVRDVRRQGVPPVWTRIRLRARTPVAVETEPGTKLTVTVGGRTYGPVQADTTGKAEAMVDVYPGENLAYAELVDGLGNSQKTTISLGVVPTPTLGAHVEGALEPGGASPVIHLSATRANGRVWRGAFPVCRPTGGDLLEVTAAGQGKWMTEVRAGSGDTGFDLRVDCLLLGTVVPVRVPVAKGLPARMVLRVYPKELSADFPIAQVQASLEDHAGERMDTTGVELGVDHGTLTLREGSTNVIRADYEGDSAHPVSKVSATWRPESTEGAVGRLSVVARLEGQRLVAEVFAANREGIPLQGAALEVEVDGENMAGTTDSSGSLVVELEERKSPQVVRAKGDGLSAAALYVPWLASGSSYGSHHPIEAEVGVQIRAGRVRNVYLSAEPSELFVGLGETAELHVRLLDGSGSLVGDEGVTLKSDAGSIGELYRRSDGSLGALFSPPPGQWAGEVVVTATANETGFAASTPVVLRPRPLESSVSVAVGPMVTAKRQNKLVVTFDAERRVSLWDERLHVRGSLNLWSDQSSVDDPERGNSVELDMDVFCVSLSALLRREAGLYSSWFGIGGTVTPYFLETQFEGLDSLQAWGLHGLGVTSMLGAGRRFVLGEVTMEGRFLGVIGKGIDLGYEGQLGGAALVLGYRVIL